MSRRLAVFFDLDGTLVDLNPERAELEQLREAVMQLASTAGVLPENRSILGTYQQVATERGFYHAAAYRIRRQIDAYEIKWARSRSMGKYNVQDFIALQHKGYTLAIVTNNGMACLQALYQMNKLRPEWFDFAVTRDDSPLLKPSPIPLERACHLARQRCPNLSKILFVGDSEHDQRAAEAVDRSTGFDLTFVKIGPSLQQRIQTASYTNLDDFLQDLL
jgi:phosphoglycolate phosphatase-like HAD superfamily hydrolase